MAVTAPASQSTTVPTEAPTRLITRRVLVAACILAFAVVATIVWGSDVPSWFDVHLQEAARDVYDWTVINNTTHWLFTGVFNPIRHSIDWMVERILDVLELLRWPGVLALVGAIGFRTGGGRAALAGVLAFGGVGALGVWDPAMLTLAIMICAVAISLAIGVPLGIASARSDRFEQSIRGVLDTAQVMPAFVYLIPLSIMFKLQIPPTVIATVIYAVPPAVRLTNHGLRAVPIVANEVAQSFGCTARQQLFKVQLPMARRTILLGLNQVIMMAFGIVVFGALLGVPDLGRLVLNGLQKNDVGAAFVPGLAIVLLAVGLDRITTGERRPFGFMRNVRLPVLARRTQDLLLVGTVLAVTAVSIAFDVTEFPSWLTIDLSGLVNDVVEWTRDHVRTGVPVIGGTQSLNDAVVTNLLEPLRSFLVWLPWLVVVGGFSALGYLSGGRGLAIVCAACLLGIGAMGTVAGGEEGRTQMWDLAMNTLSQVIVAILLAIVVAIPLGILAGRSDRLQAVLRPVLDFAQVMPAFVYLIPVLIFFNPGRGAGVAAIVIYAIPPCIRLTALGLREVPGAPREAAISFGATSRQELVKVQLPLAYRAIMLGINQTIMLALATVIIAALVGATGLGLAAYEAFAKPSQRIGPGFAAGVSIVLLAVVLDRLTQAWGKGPEQRGRS